MYSLKLVHEYFQWPEYEQRLRRQVGAPLWSSQTLPLLTLKCDLSFTIVFFSTSLLLPFNDGNYFFQSPELSNGDVDTDKETPESVSAPRRLSHINIDNMETIFLHHPRHHKYCLTCWLTSHNITAHRVDVISRFLFPLMFGIFNAIYWSIYLRKRWNRSSLYAEQQ